MIQSTPIETAHRNLQTLMLEYRGNAIHDRVDRYVSRFSARTKTMAEYLALPDVPESDKLHVLSTLTAIVSQRDWSRLPEVEEMEANGEKHEAVQSPTFTGEFTVTPELIAVIRRQARAELADVFEKVAKVLRE